MNIDENRLLSGRELYLSRENRGLWTPAFDSAYEKDQPGQTGAAKGGGSFSCCPELRRNPGREEEYPSGSGISCLSNRCG